MKNKILISLFFLIAAFTARAQFPFSQTLGNGQTQVYAKGGMGSDSGFVWRTNFADTNAANRGFLDNIPGIVIRTGDILWQRNQAATRWITVGQINNYTFISDSSVVICYTISGTSVCDTLSFNFTVNNFYFINDTTLVACDSIQTICAGTNGDSCYTQQECDTITIPSLITTQYQNGQYQLSNTKIVEAYDVGGNQAQLIHNSILNTVAYNLQYTGQPTGHEPFGVKQGQIVNLSSSVTSFNHVGGNVYTYPGMIDNYNAVNLYVNYTDRFTTGRGAPFTGDTLGFMYNRIGYLLIGNSRGGSTKYDLDNAISKQAGFMVHTLDTNNTDAVTIFGNQVPKEYAFSVSPYPTTTLLDSRITVFKTTGQVQFPKYTGTTFRAPVDTTNYHLLSRDASGNIFDSYWPSSGGGGGTLTAANSGTSLSSTTVQLGQTVAAGGNPGILLHDTEIPMGGFTLSLNASATQAANIFQTKNAAAAIRARITMDAEFSNNAGFTNSEKFGQGAVINGISATAIGNNAIANEQDVVIGRFAHDNGTGTSKVLVGKSTISAGASPGEVIIGSEASSTGATGGSNIVIGTSATTTGSGVTNVGYGSQVSGQSSIGIGQQVIVGSGHEYSQSYGSFSATTAANQVVFGAAINGGFIGVKDFYFGSGVVNISGGVIDDVSFNPTGSFGSDIAAKDFYINGAKATGNSTTGGNVIFKTSDATGSGTTLQSLTEKFRITKDGRLYGTALHNNAGAVTGTTNQYIASGTYTPTLTNVTNVTASTAYSCQWMRVGNVVTVSGKVDIDVTGAGATELGLSLPIASAMTAEENLGGTSSSAAAAALVSAIRADATNDRAAFVFTAASLTNDSYFFTFTYLIK